MTPYVQREVFRAFEQVVFEKARRAVAYVPNTVEYTKAVRCHELARAVHRRLDIGALSVVDGMCGAVEHSWLELIVPIAERESRYYYEHGVYDGTSSEMQRRVIIDVYVPGRLPQVQLVHPYPLLKPLYAAGERRTDIDEGLVVQLSAEMLKGWMRDEG